MFHCSVITMTILMVLCFFLNLSAGERNVSSGDHKSAASAAKSAHVSNTFWIKDPETVRKEPVDFMQKFGAGLDTICNRIRFKISYSFYKSREYFRLAASAPRDAVPFHTRDLKARYEEKKNQAEQKISKFGTNLRKAGQEKIDQGWNEFSRGLEQQKNNFSGHLRKAGDEFSKEAKKEFSRQKDGFFK